MATEIDGVVECRPDARLWGPDDKDAVWHSAMELWLMNVGNAYDALACLFGIRNTYGFRPLAEGRGLPADASDAVARQHADWGNDIHGTTWITWAEVLAADWKESDVSRERSREQVAGDATHWGSAWSVMRTLSDLHGASNVRLIVWFS